MRDELQLQEQRRRAAQLPLFFGMKSKDTVTAKVLLDRIASAAAIAARNNRASKEMPRSGGVCPFEQPGKKKPVSPLLITVARRRSGLVQPEE